MCVWRSPLRTFVQRIAVLDDPSWYRARLGWGAVLTIAAHGAVFNALRGIASNPEMLALLLIGVGSLTLAQGVARRSALYFGLAGCEILLALHADFFVPSYLDRDGIAWVMLGAWALALGLREARPSLVPLSAMGLLGAGMSFAVLCHVCFHFGPTSVAGLIVFAIGAILVGLTPKAQRDPDDGVQKVIAGTLWLVPVWLGVCFFLGRSENVFSTLFLLMLGVLLGIVAGLIQLWRRHALQRYGGAFARQVRLFDQSLAVAERYGRRMITVLGTLSLIGAVAVFALTYGSNISSGEMGILLGLVVGLSLLWFDLGRSGGAGFVSLMFYGSVLFAFLVLRRYLVLFTEFWTQEYDVWLTIGVSYGLAALKERFGLPGKYARWTAIGPMIVLPIVAGVLVLVHDLGTNVALLVVGIYSIKFAFLGRDNRDSPYNAVAVLGFLAFILLSFWSKLELRYVHAYVIPVGFAILVLLALFGENMTGRSRNRVRFVTLVAMLGSAAYYALANQESNLIFNLVLIVLCVLSMLMGSFFRVRLYFSLGLVVLLIDLVAVIYRVLIRADRSVQMTTVGSFVLVLGAALVFGAVYYKANRDRIEGVLNHWRKKLGAWE